MSASAVSPKPPGWARQPNNSISRPRIETVVSRSVGVFGVLYGAQALPAMLGQLPSVQPVGGILIVVAIYGGIVATLVAALAKRHVRAVNAYVSFAFLVALVAWPLVSRDPLAVASERPWLWLLCTVATSTAAVAFSAWSATAYLIVTPIIYGFVRMAPSGGAKGWEPATLDVAYAIILGGAVLILITLLRQAAASVDAAQAAALDRYSHAVRQHATEVERVHVDAIVHDSVLTTLLSAASAHTAAEKGLATRMARNAMGHLRDAAATSPDDDARVSLEQLAQRIMGATSTLFAPFERRATELTAGSVPVQSAEAVYSAAVQAMVNSLQHAGGPDVRRWLAIEAAGDDGIRIEIGDDGIGFDLDAVPSERLGLRVSILERVANAGGTVEIQSSADTGTVIWITWPGVGRS